MQNESNSVYQYDRCVSRGICSINPATASLQEVIIIYLKYISYYGLKLKEEGIEDKSIYNFILNTMSILCSNYEISRTDFNTINSSFRQELPKIIETYEKLCEKKGMTPELLDANMFNKLENISDYIRFGEKEFNKRVENLSEDIRNLYRILFILIKSICINILTLESYGIIINDELFEVMNTFNLLNTSKKEKTELKKYVIKLANSDCKIMGKLKSVQEKTYGKPEETEVSFSTTKGKGILVVGSNIKELEQILDKTKDENIDIYTHDNMILAHTYPKFKEYKNLKGQFGQGMENCLLDFSTFPGPIILTRHSLFNIENLYRGRLFTTGLAYSKGVVQIKNNDFSEVLNSVKETKGFKTGKKCASEKIGYDYEKIIKEIKEKLNSQKYSNVVIIGVQGYSNEEKEYFENFIKHIPKNTLVISHPCCDSYENIICLNSNYDFYSMLKISKEIINLKENKKINLMFPFCDRHTLSIMLNLSELDNINIYFGFWNQTTLNPNIVESLKTDFGMQGIISPKKDLQKIISES